MNRARAKRIAREFQGKEGGGGLSRQVAEAVKFLEDMELVHRDIKCVNIAISNDLVHATLMDLRVIRLLKLSELTHQDYEKHNA